jgi:hypothetical protein
VPAFGAKWSTILLLGVNGRVVFVDCSALGVGDRVVGVFVPLLGRGS